jgi:alkane 1-monooxygenase
MALNVAAIALNVLLLGGGVQPDRGTTIVSGPQNCARYARLVSVTANFLRALPFAFPLIFVCAAILGSITFLYAAVMLHVAVIGAENTAGRWLAKASGGPSAQISKNFEDACLFAWPAVHLAALMAAQFLIIRLDPPIQQAFAIGAIFCYSVNTFAATAGHELLHRPSPAARACGDVLYATMLYPHWPTVHFASHHRWAGCDRDCQTPRAGQRIHSYLYQALIGGLRVTYAAPTTFDPRLRWRAVVGLGATLALCFVGWWQILIFLVVQAAFSFLVIETLNYVQHYNPIDDRASPFDDRPRLANQDCNFVSCCMLSNLPLHAAHHVDEGVHCTELVPIPGAPSHCRGYWTSFWLAWIPPLWIKINSSQ